MTIWSFGMEGWKEEEEEEDFTVQSGGLVGGGFNKVGSLIFLP